METVSITSENEISLDEINRALAQQWRVEGAGKDRLVIQEQNSRVYVYPDSSAKTTGVRPRLLIDYSDIELVKRVLQTIADSPQLVVDNDFGTILPGNEFVARIRSDRGWNWRHK